MIDLYAAFEDASAYYLVQELAAKGDLFVTLRNKKGQLTEKDVVQIMLPVMEALKYLHDNGIIHRRVQRGRFCRCCLHLGHKLLTGVRCGGIFEEWVSLLHFPPIARAIGGSRSPQRPQAREHLYYADGRAQAGGLRPRDLLPRRAARHARRDARLHGAR